MARYLADTDWVIEYLNKNPQIRERLDAATCLQYDLTLLTNNRRHFEMVEGLRIISL